MKVKEIMIQNTESCSLTDNLKKAAEIMQKINCDLVPVVNERNQIIATVTHKTVSLAMANVGQKAAALRISEINLDKVFICLADEKIEKALKIMKKKLAEQLIVTDQNGMITGIISINKILSLPGKNKKLQKKVFSVLKAIYKPRPLFLREIDLSKINN